MDTNFQQLREAVAGDVDNVALRVHLCDLLIEHGRLDEAWTEIRDGIGYAPDDVALLGLAARVLSSMGNHALACRYERVLDAVIASFGSGSIDADAADSASTAYESDRSEDEPSDAAEPAPDDKDPGDKEPEDKEPDDKEPAAGEPDQSDRGLDVASSDEAASADDPETEATPSLTSVIHDLREDSDEPETAPVSPARAAAQGWDASIEPGRRLIEIRQPWTSLDRQVGMTKLRGELYRFCDEPVTSKQSGLLLWGPNGCGKATYADACAGTLERRVVHVHVAEAVEAWLVKGRHEIAAMFAEAEANAPCVLFLDGFDALCGHAALVTQALREFLTRLDKMVREHGDRIAVVASTQRPWLLNRNVIEPRRFGTQLLVQAPDAEARAAILSEQLADLPTGRVDIEGLAAATPNYSAADLVFLCKLAAEYAIFDSLDTGKNRPISMQDLVRAIDETAASTSEWFRTARDHATNAEGTDLR